MENGGQAMKQIQLNKYKECLIHVNSDLRMLLQNAENLAHKLGVIRENEMHYLSYDYYKQYKKRYNDIKKKYSFKFKFFIETIYCNKVRNRKRLYFPTFNRGNKK